MRNILKDRRGYAMAYVVLFIGLVGLPLMLLSVEVVRAMYVESLVQTAVDAACEASVQAVDVLLFIQTGELIIVPSDANALAQSEFASNVTNYSIANYSPSLAPLTFVTPTVVQCNASAMMEWLLPGIPGLTLNVDSLSAVKAHMY